MNRRSFLGGAAAVGTAAVGTAGFARPAISQNSQQWRFLSFWPKGLPGVWDELVDFTQSIETASGGRLSIKIYGAGELVPALEIMDAVSGGSAEMGHGAPYFWKGKVPATQFLAGMPFGMTTQEMNAWYRYGDGQSLADEVYAEMNCKFLLGGNTGVQMGGWYNKEINAIEDFNGLKIRIPGLGAEVMKAAGANVVLVPGAEALTALSTGNIDAADWVGPFNDLAGGLYKAAQYYYYPGWHEPTTVLDCFVNRPAWDALDDDLRAIVTHAAAMLNERILSGYTARNNSALATLISEHGVELRRFSDAVLVALGKLATEVVTDIAGSDPLSARVFEAVIAFRKDAVAWSNLSELTFQQARALDYGDFG